MSFKKIKVTLLDKDGSEVTGVIDKVFGTGVHQVDATKEYTKGVNLLRQLMVACKKLGVTDTLIEEIEPKRERKAHKRLTKLQQKALRKDSKKLSVKELAARYDVSLPTVKKYLS